MPVDTVVGENIRMARLVAGLSQADLGGACGVTFQQIQKYEKGTNRVGGSRLMQIAEALKVPAATLLPPSQKHAVTPKHRAPTILQDRIGMDIARAWDKLSREQRIVIRDLIDAIASLNARTRIRPHPVARVWLRPN
jgi:transcriptional regulator with XRE-family HTH domain